MLQPEITRKSFPSLISPLLEPETVDFKLDGVNDPCSKNEDINFVLTG